MSAIVTAINALDQKPPLLAQKILDSADDTFGKSLVKASYNVAGDLVTVTHPDHQIPNGEDVIVEGAADAGINGTYTITVVDVDTYTYTPTAPPANPDALADVPLPGEILVSQEHVSYVFKIASAIAVFVTGGNVEVQVKLAPYMPWFNIVATISADSVVEFPVPYNYARVIRALPLAGDASAYAQGIPGSPV